MAVVTLIRPPIVVPKWAHTTIICPPVGMAYLAASLREAGHDARVIDSTGEAPFNVQQIQNGKDLLATGLSTEKILDRIDPRTEVFGFSCMFSNEWPIAHALIRRVRQEFPGRPIVVGGEHINSVPEYTLQNYPEVDVCALGEGEETFNELLEKMRRGDPYDAVAGTALRSAGGIRRNPDRQRIRAVDEIPLPAWDLIPISNYLDNGFGYGVHRGRSMPIMATRGCPYQCTFCSSPTMWTTRWIARDVRRVLEEIKLYLDKYRAQNIDFYDLTAVVRREWILTFCQEIARQNLNFTWQLPSGTRSEAIDWEVSYWMSESGCRNITYAPESGSPSVLKRIKKRVDLEKMKDSMRAALRNGMAIKCNLIMGFPDETHREIWETLRFMAQLALLGVQDAVPANFSPYPGSELFEQLRREGKIRNLDDEYFWNLSVQTSFFRTVSCSRTVGSKALMFYLLFGLFLFYSISFLSHPLRFFRIFVLNPLRNRQETRFEKGFQGVFRRLLSKKEAVVLGSPSK